MKINVNEAPNRALNWAVAKCLTVTQQAHGFTVIDGQPYVILAELGGLQGAFYVEDWDRGGKLIEPYIQSLNQSIDNGRWYAWPKYVPGTPEGEVGNRATGFGDTPLQAVVRCYITRVLGPVIDVPKDLLT